MHDPRFNGGREATRLNPIREDGIESNNWGEGPAADDGYLWYRALPYADLHLGRHVRAFGQLAVAFADDKNPR